MSVNDSRRVLCKKHEIHYPEDEQCPWCEERVRFIEPSGDLDLESHGKCILGQSDDDNSNDAPKDAKKNNNPYGLSDEQLKELDDYANRFFGI